MKFILTVLFILSLGLIHSPAQVAKKSLLRIGGGYTWNAMTKAVGPQFRITVPVIQDLELSAQMNNVNHTGPTPLQTYNEYYFDMNINLYFLEYGINLNGKESDVDLYVHGGYSLERWFNSKSFDQGVYKETGPQNFNGFNLGTGWRCDFSRYFAIYNDLRYYSNFREISVQIGLELVLNAKKFKHNSRMKPKAGPKNDNILDCPKF